MPNDVESGAICSKNGLKFDNFIHKNKVFVCCCYFVSCLFFLFSHLSNFPLSPASLDSTLVAIGYLSASSPQESNTLTFGSLSPSWFLLSVLLLFRRYKMDLCFVRMIGVSKIFQ